MLEAFAPFDGREGRAEVLVACDVRTPFRDAAVVFGPQKGASPEQVVELTGRLDRLASLYKKRYGVDLATVEGSGAAGGLGGGLAALGHGSCPGSVSSPSTPAWTRPSVRPTPSSPGRASSTRSRSTARSSAASSSWQQERGVPALVVAGVVDGEVAGRVASVSLLEQFGSEASWGDPLRCVTQAAEQWLRREWTAQ